MFDQERTVPADGKVAPSPGTGFGDDLFQNHLAFLSGHRGKVVKRADSVELIGAAPFLSSWTPLHDDVQLPPDAATVRLIPSSGGSWVKMLHGGGWALDQCLSYMELGELASASKPQAEHSIRAATSENEADAFASVQSAAFLDPETPHRDWWIDFFQRMARKNIHDPNQEFLIAWVGEKPAAVLLSVYTGALAGIYAVATCPDYQRLGLSTALLHEARKRALGRGKQRMALQANAGSYAAGFYARLGFVQAYVSQVWTRSGQ